MKLLSLLITLALIALFVKQQLSSNTKPNGLDHLEDQTTLAVPKTPEDLKTFEKDMNQLLHDLSAKRNLELEKMTESAK